MEEKREKKSRWKVQPQPEFRAFNLKAKKVKQRKELLQFRVNFRGKG